MVKEGFVRKTASWAIFWVSYWLMIMFVMSTNAEWWLAMRRATVIMVMHFIVSSINLHWMIPWLFIPKNYIGYILAALGLALLMLLLQTNFFEMLMQPNDVEQALMRKKETMLLRWGSTIMVLAASTAYKVVLINQEKEKELTLLKNERLEQEREASALKNENLETELKFLKSQINPHFLFNALHNIYTLSYIKSDLAPEMVLKLSDMLRYILYDCTAEKVPLGKEVGYLKNYVELQQLKAEEADIKLMIASDLPQELPMAPMLMVPFVENSFKHGKIEDIQNGWVRLELRWEAPYVCFNVENSVPDREFTKDKVGGIGIANVKRRLELLYEDYTLDICSTKQTYRVVLKIRAVTETSKVSG